MSFLKFEVFRGLDHDYILVTNGDSGAILGEERGVRVGRWIQWCFCPAPHGPEEILFFTGPCQRQMLKFHEDMTKKYGTPRLHFLPRGIST